MNNIATAFVFLLFNISINTAECSIGLFPSFVGYLFLFRGCQCFERVEDSLAILTVPAAGMAIVEGIYYALLLVFGEPEPYVVSMTLKVLSLTAALYFVYRVEEGVGVLEEHYDMDLGYLHLKKATVCLFLLLLVGISLICLSGQGGGALVIGLGITWLGALRFCVTFFRLSARYKDRVRPNLRHTV